MDIGGIRLEVLGNINSLDYRVYGECNKWLETVGYLNNYKLELRGMGVEFLIYGGKYNYNCRNTQE